MKTLETSLKWTYITDISTLPKNGQRVMVRRWDQCLQTTCLAFWTPPDYYAVDLRDDEAGSLSMGWYQFVDIDGKEHYHLLDADHAPFAWCEIPSDEIPPLIDVDCHVVACRDVIDKIIESDVTSWDRSLQCFENILVSVPMKLRSRIIRDLKSSFCGDTTKEAAIHHFVELNTYVIPAFPRLLRNSRKGLS